MGGGRNPLREEQVKGLNVGALAHGTAAVLKNSGRPLVRDLVATSKHSAVRAEGPIMRRYAA